MSRMEWLRPSRRIGMALQRIFQGDHDKKTLTRLDRKKHTHTAPVIRRYVSRLRCTTSEKKLMYRKNGDSVLRLRKLGKGRLMMRKYRPQQER